MDILGLFDQVERVLHPIILEKGFWSHPEILEKVSRQHVGSVRLGFHSAMYWSAQSGAASHSLLSGFNIKIESQGHDHFLFYKGPEACRIVKLSHL